MLAETLGDGADTLTADLGRSNSLHFLQCRRRSRRSARLRDGLKVIFPLCPSVVTDAHPCLIPHRFQPLEPEQCVRSKSDELPFLCARLAGALAEDLQQGFVVLHHSGAVGINVTVCCSVEHVAVAVGSPQARSFCFGFKVRND